MLRSISSIATLFFLISSATGICRNAALFPHNESSRFQYLAITVLASDIDVSMIAAARNTGSVSTEYQTTFRRGFRRDVLHSTTVVPAGERAIQKVADKPALPGGNDVRYSLTAHPLAFAASFYRQSTARERWYLLAVIVLLFALVILLWKQARERTGRIASANAAEALPGRLIRAQEEERRRIARELHDDVSQRLALICCQIDIMRGTPPNSQERLVEELSTLYEETNLLSSDIHDFSRELHPAILERLGLSTALRRYCSEFSKRQKIAVNLQIRGEEPTLHQETSLTLFRAGQECLTNIAKHSRANSCDVVLSYGQDEVMLTIEDQGSGFDPRKRKAGLGMESMRERVRLVGGTLDVDSAPLCGTKISVEAPVERFAPRNTPLKFHAMRSKQPMLRRA